MPDKPNLFQRIFGKKNLENQRVTNPVTRAAAPWSLFGLGVDRAVKHDLNVDFGYPDFIEFLQLHNMYRRNGLAHAAVNAVVNKCYQSYPMLSHTDEGSEETPQEMLVRMHFRKLRLWQRFIECDRRSQVGGYAGLILRIADGKMFNEPVEGGFAGAGVEAIVEVIPAWRGQLRVQEYGKDTNDEMYGKPTLYLFQEAEVIEPNEERQQPRSFTVHPDRILIVSKDGTIYCESDLEAGYNALLDAEKVLGAGGEGFWRNARGAPFFEVDKELQTAETHRGLGVSGQDEFQTTMTTRVKDWLSGFSNYLMIKGVKPHFPNVALPSPEFYFKNVAQYFASSMGIP